MGTQPFPAPETSLTSELLKRFTLGPLRILSSQSCTGQRGVCDSSLCLRLPPGYQDLPEKEELRDVQLPTVLLPVRHAGPALREPV